MRFIDTVDELTGKPNGGSFNIEMAEYAKGNENGTVTVLSLSGETYTVSGKDFRNASDRDDHVSSSVVRRLIDSIERLSARIPSSIRMHL